MSKNIQEVLGRGEQLDRMSNASEQLLSRSKGYLKDSRQLNWNAFYQKYGPPIIVIGVVGLVFYLRVFWW